jgi:hypothetical protein
MIRHRRLNYRQALTSRSFLSAVIKAVGDAERGHALTGAEAPVLVGTLRVLG